MCHVAPREPVVIYPYPYPTLLTWVVMYSLICATSLWQPLSSPLPWPV